MDRRPAIVALLRSVTCLTVVLALVQGPSTTRGDDGEIIPDGFSCFGPGLKDGVRLLAANLRLAGDHVGRFS